VASQPILLTSAPQNRGTYLDIENPHGQWRPLKRWLSTRRHSLGDALGANLILFGEWCYAIHSVRYVRLPDWFLCFDVYDRSTGEFWSVDRNSRPTTVNDDDSVSVRRFMRFHLPQTTTPPLDSPCVSARS
jgi:hypothetical protein